jgi:hypothetical protein
VSVNDSKIISYCLFPQSFSSVKIQIFLFCNDFRHVFDIAIMQNDHIIFNVGTPSLEARNIRLVNIITYIIEESKSISENMWPNVIHC